MNKTKVGIIGCGAISGIYFEAGKKFEILEIAACADQNEERAKAKAAENGAQALSVDQLLADPEIEIVLNLTVPKAHYPVCKAALEAGKHVYVEKPLSLTRDEGQELLTLARARNLRIGSAPDTFLGAGLQTCRALIDSGAIGQPVAANAFMLSHGPESWHPDPEFYYQPGGGPMFDMGPYYLTALVSLLGPIRRISGSAGKGMPERTIGSGAKKGKIIPVEVPTHLAGVMDFHNGAIGTLSTSFDIWTSRLPCIEIYGTEGSLSVPDPNTFGGPVQIWTTSQREWRDVEITRPYAQNSRGIGAADIAYSIRSGRPHRASGDLAYHVLEAMHGFHDASANDASYMMQSQVSRPAPLPEGLTEGELDA